MQNSEAIYGLTHSIPSVSLDRSMPGRARLLVRLPQPARIDPGPTDFLHHGLDQISVGEALASKNPQDFWNEKAFLYFKEALFVRLIFLSDLIWRGRICRSKCKRWRSCHNQSRSRCNWGCSPGLHNEGNILLELPLGSN